MEIIWALLCLLLNFLFTTLPNLCFKVWEFQMPLLDNVKRVSYYSHPPVASLGYPSKIFFLLKQGNVVTLTLNNWSKAFFFAFVANFGLLNPKGIIEWVCLPDSQQWHWLELGIPYPVQESFWGMTILKGLTVNVLWTIFGIFRSWKWLQE